MLYELVLSRDPGSLYPAPLKFRPIPVEVPTTGPGLNASLEDITAPEGRRDCKRVGGGKWPGYGVWCS